MGIPLRVVFIDETQTELDLILQQLARGGFEPAPAAVGTRAEMETLLAAGRPDLIISGYNESTGFNALHALAFLKENDLDLPFIVVSSKFGEGPAVAVMEAGAHDYISQTNVARLVPAVKRELREAEDRKAHRRAEQALRLEHKKLFDILEAMGDGVCIIGENYEIEYVNPQMRSDFGPVNGQKCHEYFNGRATVCPWCKRRDVSAGQSFRSEWNSSKNRKFYDLITTPLFNADGSVSRLDICHDVSDRKQAEDALAAEKESLSVTLHSIGDGVITTDRRGCIMLLNAVAAEMTGWTQAEAAGLPLTDVFRVVDEVTKQPVENPVDMVLRHGNVVSLANHTVLIARDGTERIIADTGAPIRDKQGLVFGVVLVFHDITGRKKAEAELNKSMDKLRRAMEGAIQAMALTVEIRDPYTAGHQRRVAQLAAAIAAEMSLPADQIDGIRFAAAIHDIGKIYIPAEILSKPGRITEHEFNMIRTHPQVGYDILKTIEFPWPIAQIVLQHHKRIDGSGYPLSEPGEELLTEAKILSIADVVEAMSSHRPYRPALGKDRALREISANRGLLYDGQMVDVCLKLFTEKGFEFDA